MHRYLWSIPKFIIGELFQTVCYFCGARTDAVLICGYCHIFQEVDPTLNCLTQGQSEMDTINSYYWLDDRARELLHLAKYHRKPWFLNAMRPSQVKLRSRLDEADAIIPVPISFEKFLCRGFNQTWLIGRWIASALSIRVVCDGLIKESETPPQATLTKRERLENLKGSFRWNLSLTPPNSVILVDDLLTTGATLEECARVLKRAGVQKVVAWTLFKAPRH